MEQLELKHLLFKVAFCAMTCDGYIDKREIDELKTIEKKTSYFSDIDLSKELETIIKELNGKKKNILNDLLETIQKNDINVIQELLIIEVAIRIINADEKIEENEKWFFNLLRSKLKVHNRIITERFGNIEILYGENFNQNVIKTLSYSDISDKFKLPELIHFKNLTLQK